MRVPRVRERTATPQELEEDKRRCLAAKAKLPTPAPTPENEANLAAVLVTFARWRKCCCCQALVLYVGANARATGDVECKLCVDIREDLARRLRRTSLPARVGLHLRALFSTSNDNGVALTVGG
jgi:hypothetical protein